MMYGYGETPITPETVYTDAELASQQPPGTCSCCWRTLIEEAICNQSSHAGVCRDCDYCLEHTA
ncbi:MAG: hypothetical protein QM582_00825 [Micropruina sp.]|uniref:hypothetical protein n=1 Tax=Micropruina sp. TaxID=2737536 RepID=UPI0039E30F59